MLNGGLQVGADLNPIDLAPQAGMVRRLQGGPQGQRGLLAESGAHPLAHPAKGPEDEDLAGHGAHRRPNSFRTTWRRSRFGAVSVVSGSLISSSIMPRSERAAFTGIGFVSQKSTSNNGRSR